MGKRNKVIGNVKPDNRLFFFLVSIVALILFIFLGPLGWQKLRYDETKKYVDSLQKVETFSTVVKDAQSEIGQIQPILKVNESDLYKPIVAYSPAQPCQKIGLFPISPYLEDTDNVIYYDQAWNIFWIKNTKIKESQYYGPFKYTGTEKNLPYKDNLSFTDFWGETIKKTFPIISQRIPCDLW